MNRVDVMALQPTRLACISHFVRPHERLNRRKNKVTPKIIMMIEIIRPQVPCRVMSPKPVVVSAAMVK